MDVHLYHSLHNQHSNHARKIDCCLREWHDLTEMKDLNALQANSYFLTVDKAMSASILKNHAVQDVHVRVPPHSTLIQCCGADCLNEVMHQPHDEPKRISTLDNQIT